MKQNSKAIIFALTAIFFWSTVATAFKLSLKTLNFYNLLLISSITSTIVLSFILFLKKEFKSSFKINIKQLRNSAFLGFLNPFLYYLVLLKAYSLLPAQIAQPLNYTWPIVLVILSSLILGKKVSLLSLIALLICLIGVLVISMQGNFVLKIKSPLGIILATGSSIIWALFWLFNMKDKRSETQKLFLNFIFGTIYIVIYTLLFDKIDIKFNYSFLSSVYIGIFEMGVTFVLWLIALQKAESPEKISSLVYLSPFISIFFIHFILHEKIHYTTIIGLILIVLGIVLSKSKKNLTNKV